MAVAKVSADTAASVAAASTGHTRSFAGLGATSVLARARASGSRADMGAMIGGVAPRANPALGERPLTP